LFEQVPRVAHGQRDDRLHRVDTQRSGEQAGVGDEQPGHAVHRAEAVGDAATRVLAHPRGAHQVDRVHLHRGLGYRAGQQVPQLAGAADLGRAVEGEQHPPRSRREQRLPG
jgi:hypothetical protein